MRMTLYHAAPVTRSLAIMLRGFHDGRDAATNLLGRGICFEVDPVRTNATQGIMLAVEDGRVLRRFAVSLWPQRGSSSGRSYLYVLPADVANCYTARMVGNVSAIDRLLDG